MTKADSKVWGEGRGRVNAYGQPDRKIFVLFYDFPYRRKKSRNMQHFPFWLLLQLPHPSKGGKI